MAIIDDNKNLPIRRPFTIDGTARVIDKTAQTPKLPAPQATPTTTTPTLGQKAWGVAKAGANKAGRSWVGLSGLTGLAANASTPSEDYYERFGMPRYDDSRGALGHFGVRSLGYASDVGNALSGGTIGDLVFADKIRQKQEAEQAKNTPTPTQSNQQDKPKDLSNQMAEPDKQGNVDTQNLITPQATQSNTVPQQTYTPQLGLGILNNNPNYQALMSKSITCNSVPWQIRKPILADQHTLHSETGKMKPKEKNCCNKQPRQLKEQGA